MYDMPKFFDPEALTKAFDMDNALKAQKKTVEAWRKANSVVTDGTNAIIARQFEIMENAMEDGIEAMRELATAKGVEDYMTKQNTLWRSNVERATESARETATMAGKTQQQITDLLNKQWQENAATFTAHAKKAATTAKK